MGKWIAGVNHANHDSSAALLCDGRLVAMAEQERFSRNKRAIDEPPVEALRWCLDYAGIRIEDLDALALGSDNDALARWMNLSDSDRETVLVSDNPERLMPRYTFGTADRPPLVPVRHHMAHAAGCYWPSGFEEAAVLVVDNRGEDSSTTLAYATPSGINVLKSYPIKYSLGLFYRIATEYAGLYSRDGNAGKLMGLASYGNPVYNVALGFGKNGPEWTGVPEPTESGAALPQNRTEQLLDFFEKNAFPYTRGLRDEITAYIDFAASVQLALEDTLLGLAAELRERTRSRNLCIAGGVGLNCTANGRLATESGFDNIFIQPLAHDAGSALGAAYEVTHRLGVSTTKSDPMSHAMWGPIYSRGEILNFLQAKSLRFVELDDTALASICAKRLSMGEVVGLFHGRAEVGPRALGSRSLLGDPRRRETLLKINNIKGREMWRPLAPSVLMEHFSEFFTGIPNPFMLIASTVREEMRPRIPAVVHIDGTARPQSVDRRTHPFFAEVISHFADLTSIPVVVNTSLNTAGVPIVNTPNEALKMYSETEMDALVLGSFFVY